MGKKLNGEKVILGIDPGTNITGYGIVAGKGNSMRLITYGVIDLRKVKGGHPEKLKRIFERTRSLILEFKPDAFAIESPFFGKNIQSMLKLGRAQGVAIAAAVSEGLPVAEYAPKKVKMAITGNGNASKEMVFGMVEKLLNFKFDLKDPILTHDASDGLAAALCHYLQKDHGGSGSGSKSYGGWNSFLSQNPDRIKKR